MVASLYQALSNSLDAFSGDSPKPQIPSCILSPSKAHVEEEISDDENVCYVNYITDQILALFDEEEIRKCFHCEKEDGILVRLNPSGDIKKTVCMECLWARHPKTALEILEYILDKEQAQALKEGKQWIYRY